MTAFLAGDAGKQQTGSPRQPPAGPGDRRELSHRRGAPSQAGSRPSAGAQRMAFARPLYARAHERCQIVRALRATGRGHGRPDGRRSDRVAGSELQAWRQGADRSRLATVRRGRGKRTHADRCRARTRIVLPRHSGHAGCYRLVRPVRDRSAESGRNGGRIGCVGCRGQRGGAARENRGVPSGRNRRGTGQVRLRR